jgi:serine/threonine-protein kinase
MESMAERDAAERLIQLVSGEGFGAGPSHELDEALRIFADVRFTPRESHAIALLLTVHAARRLPDALVVPLAAALVDRGDAVAAAKALGQSSSPAALMLRADLLARGGRLHDAADMVERVLFQDLDWPGARERHARWRGAATTLSGDSRSTRPPPPPATPPAEGEASPRRSLDRAPFRIVREIARGGTGTVYEAEDRELGRRVALKVYHQPERDRAQLLHEVRVPVALAGEGVVRVFDVDADHGWLAMPWAPLGALGLRLRARDADVLRAIRGWSRSLARALARVHRSGWVHHDVKPANVLLDAPERAILTDFATARRVGEPGPPGSHGYVSPERLAGRSSDPRDDIFGFGRILEGAVDARSARGGTAGEPRSLEGWRALARACTGPDANRPRDGADLADRLAAFDDGEREEPRDPA